MNNGGPAFPALDARTMLSGMSLRDYFAAMAVPGLLAHPNSSTAAGPEAFANAAYQMADAMLKERSKA